MSQAAAATRARAMASVSRNSNVSWASAMKRSGFSSKRFKRLAWGDGDAYPYTPRCKARFQWDDWPVGVKVLFLGTMAGHAFGWIWFMFSTSAVNTSTWNEVEAMRRGRLRREAQELMILEGVEYGHNDDRQPDRA